MMSAGEIMQRQVITIRQTAPIYELTQLLKEKKISGVPVCDDFEMVVGIVSQSNLTQMEYGYNVGDIMTRKVIAVDPDTPVQEVAMVMHEKNIKRVPVFKEGKMLGIISRSDIVAAVAKALISI